MYQHGQHGLQSVLVWINSLLGRTMRLQVRSTQTKRTFFKWKKVMDDFFHGRLAGKASRWRAVSGCLIPTDNGGGEFQMNPHKTSEKAFLKLNSMQFSSA